VATSPGRVTSLRIPFSNATAFARRGNTTGHRASVWSTNELGLGTPTQLDEAAVECESRAMTRAAKKLIDEFEALPDEDRTEVLVELLRRAALAPHDLPSEDDLTAAADRLFADLDRREDSE